MFCPKIKRTFLISHLLLLALALPSLAETEQPDNVSIEQPKSNDVSVEQLEEMSLEDLLNIRISDVTGVSKSKESYKHVPMSVYTVEKEELSRWGVRYLPEVLQRVPGFSFYNIDYYGQYGAMARGLYSIWRFGYSIELMKLPDYGHTIFAPNFYKSVEIARGPSGLAWGSSAEAGLINVNLRDDIEGTEVIMDFGNVGRVATDVMFGHKFENPEDNFFAGLHFERQGFDVQQPAFDNSKEKWKVNGINPSYMFLSRMKYKDFKIVTLLEHDDHVAPHSWYGTDSNALQNALEKELGNIDFHDQMDILSVRPEYHIPLGILKENNDFINDIDLFLYLDYFKKQWWTNGIAVDSQRKIASGFNLTSSMFSERLNFNLGGDIWGQDRNSDPAFTSTWAKTNHGIDWYDKNLDATSTNFFNYFGQASYNIMDNLRILGGARIDFQKGGKPQELMLGASRLGLIYDPISTLTLKYIFNTTNRRPQFNEVFEGDSTYETLMAHDVIAIYKPNNDFQADVTLFHQNLSNAITRSSKTGQNFNTFFNAGGIQTIGGEWSLKYKPINQLLLYCNGSYNDARALEGHSTVDGEDVIISMPANAFRQPLFVPATTAFIGGELALFDLFSVNLAARGILSIPYFGVDNSEQKSNAVFLDLSLKTKKLWDHVTFSVVGLNLLNSQTRLPAFGEHSSNVNGTLAPEGFRTYARVTFDF